MSERMNELSVNLGASEKAAVESAAGAEAIVDCVFRVILERRLPPAAKLSERVLCEVFRTSRSTVRRALLVLAERGTVALLPNRGAFVAVPSSEEARAVFEARQTIEPTIASKAALEVTAEQVSHLKRHLEAEAGARDRGARHDAIRLSGQFHVELAKYARNPVLARFVEELVARTSLIIGLFGATEATLCMCDEHEALVSAIERHDGERAQEIMLSHLAHIENELELSDRTMGNVDIRAVLQM
jgi:DNA-binding GntR family transcriptional regulator